MREMQGVGRRPRVTAWNTACLCVQRVFAMLCVALLGLAGQSVFAKTAIRLTASTSPSFVDDCGTTELIGGFFRAALIGMLMLIGGAAHAQSWTKIASEGASFSVNGTQTVRYGAGSTWIQKIVSGSGTCTNAYFGSDPVFGTTKECDVLNSASSTPTTTVLTASANPVSIGQSITLTASITGASPTGTVTFKDGATTLGTGTISDGKATLATSLSITGARSLTASYAGDANNGASLATLSETVNATGGTWTKIASEGASFSVSGTQTVRYGAGSTWIQKTVSGSGACTNAYFSDPLPGTVKECDVLSSGGSTPTTSG